MISELRKNIAFNVKNLFGWKTNRKIVVFSVDDYGNVRIDSPGARAQLNKAGVTLKSRFDTFDTLESRQDLNMLLETLRSVTDKNGRHAVFTAYAVPCNINFEKLEQTGYRKYHYEILPQTFQKKETEDPENYSGAWKLWKEGIEKGLIVPQFHGREHINLKVFEEKLAQNDSQLLTQLQNRSFTTISNTNQKTISPLAAFDFWAFKDNKQFHRIIKDGLNKFEEVFGYRAQNFTPPAYSAHPILYSTLQENSIRFVDTALIANNHQGNGKYKRQFNYTGKKENGLYKMVRNVVFEPTDDRGVDWPSYAMQQIEAAFRWNRPAIISSHRVNFCGHIDPKNREKGLGSLKELLKKITKRWPEVEFMAANELGQLIMAE